MKIKTSELSGGALDFAVANAVEAWKTAHQLFPTWTLDATFSGVQPMIYSDGEAFCQLIPNNPMRQDAQKYSPSTDWSQGGPLIDAHSISFATIGTGRRDANGKEPVVSIISGVDGGVGQGPTHLIAACRAIVHAKVGESVEIPDDLVTA